MKIWAVFVRRSDETDPVQSTSPATTKATSPDTSSETGQPENRGNTDKQKAVKNSSDGQTTSENVAVTTQANESTNDEVTKPVDEVSPSPINSEPTVADSAADSPKETVVDESRTISDTDEEPNAENNAPEDHDPDDLHTDEPATNENTDDGLNQETTKDLPNNEEETRLNTDNSPETGLMDDTQNVDGSEDVQSDSNNEKESENEDKDVKGDQDDHGPEPIEPSEPDADDEAGDVFVDEPEVNGEPESDNVGTDNSDKSEEIVVSEPDHVNPTVNNDLQKPLAVFFLLSLIVTFVLYKIKRKTQPTGRESRGRYVALSDDDDEPLATTSFSSSSKNLTREEHNLLTNSDSEEERDVWRVTPDEASAAKG